MPRNGSGAFARVHDWTADADAAINIRADRMDEDSDDFATALTASLAKDGQTTPTANLPMGGYRHTGVGAATARTQYVDVAGLQDGSYNWVAGGGTADAITATYSPALTALVDGQLCFVRAGYANATTAPTFAPSALTAHAITKVGGALLTPGDISGAGHELYLRYNLANTRWELLNPASCDAGYVVKNACVYASSTTFTVAGIDVTTIYTVGRRVKAVGSSTGTIYGTISAVAFSTNTTVTVVWDSGSLSNETLTISLSQAPITGAPIGGQAIGPAVSTAWTPIDSSGASLSLTVNSARYMRIGPLVYFSATVTYPSTANSANATIGGLPFTSLDAANSGAGCIVMSFAGGGASILGVVEQNSTTITVRNTSMANVANSTLSTFVVRFQGFYWAA